MSYFSNARYNNGMHPTADTLLLIYLYGAGRRVMPGVSCFVPTGGLCRIIACRHGC
jgi:hypothetical protein